MQIFRCPTCSEKIYFNNTTCRCGEEVTFDPDRQAMLIGMTGCANRSKIGCNWVAENGQFCRSCAMTVTVPDLGNPENIELWARTEGAKRWMLANLARWGWFTPDDPGARPMFRLLSEHTSAGDANVIMGHADGVITINVVEASDSVRSERRENLGELYRTMLGHMRHEMAHFLQLRLAEDAVFLEGFRALFGDERADYGEALKKHYASPGQPGERFITSYATAHPHEDWAETIAHLLHLVDLLDSAASTGLGLPSGPPEGYDAYADDDAQNVITMAVEIAIAINHVNRAMDLPDLYPFVLPSGVREKLAFAVDHLKLNNSR
ncbi:putative zinc-binding metallopeptidase [Palleronia sp. LCG004]|uniref:zinc-binding metallopeptidase family protein n=1 Tax=Palleronia sp. LCG004 TaxID=3079304 RepID=UPI002943D809|nr:putative zinc-binding metallopeptidase [Palleronia sp. LCG004]WOI58287.1 putative zinc-binding metallopeptidase [Palleronia sp. LCG004]